MNIAFSAKKSGIFNKMDERFARAEIFLIYHTEDHTFSQADNTSSQEAAQGASIKAVELLVRNEVDAVVTAKCGPKAEQALEAAGITVFITDQKTVTLALDDFLQNHPQEL